MGGRLRRILVILKVAHNGPEGQFLIGRRGRASSWSSNCPVFPLFIEKSDEVLSNNVVNLG